MKIYVVTHKPCDGALPKNYEYMQVNAKNNGAFYALNDAIGEDEISQSNPFFCELTAAYWIWKNDKQNDVVGLVHYRRFFTVNRFSSSPKKYINEGRVNKHLKKYDFIATKPYKTADDVKSHTLSDVREKDYELLRDTLSRVYPEYLPDFDSVMGGHSTYLLNMFICKKQAWDAYYGWLFKLLFEMQKSVDMTGYSVQEQRLYGFLAERLFTVYAKHNGLKIKSYPVHIVGSPKSEIIIQKLQKILRIRR